MTTASFAMPPASPSPVAPRLPSRTAQRVSLTLVLWMVWGTPLGYIAMIGPKMGEIFSEFGVKLGAGALAAVQIASLLASPLGLLFLMAGLPALCLAVSAIILPPRRAAAIPERARWPFVVIAVVGSTVASVAIWATFSIMMSGTMMTIAEKLKSTAPAQSAPAAGAPAR